MARAENGGWHSSIHVKAIGAGRKASCFSEHLLIIHNMQGPHPWLSAPNESQAKGSMYFPCLSVPPLDKLPDFVPFHLCPVVFTAVSKMGVIFFSDVLTGFLSSP